MDSFFKFSNEEVRVHQKNAKNRTNGFRTLVDCGEYLSTIPFETLSGETTQISSSSSLVEIKSAVENTLQNLSTSATDGTSPEDTNNGKINFIILILKQISFALVSAVISPKNVNPTFNKC